MTNFQSKGIVKFPACGTFFKYKTVLNYSQDWTLTAFRVSKTYTARSFQFLPYFIASGSIILSRIQKTFKIWIYHINYITQYLQKLQSICVIVSWTHTWISCHTFFHYLDYYHSISSSPTSISQGFPLTAISIHKILLDFPIISIEFTLIQTLVVNLLYSSK